MFGQLCYTSYRASDTIGKAYWKKNYPVSFFVICIFYIYGSVRRVIITGIYVLTGIGKFSSILAFKGLSFQAAYFQDKHWAINFYSFCLDWSRTPCTYNDNVHHVTFKEIKFCSNAAFYRCKPIPVSNSYFQLIKGLLIFIAPWQVLHKGHHSCFTYRLINIIV